MSEIRKYRDLEAWQKAMDLVEAVYELSSKLPSGERFGLTSQIQRSAVSVPANIAEGHARLYRREFVRQLSVARGSLAELETHLTLAVRLKLLTREDVLPVWETAQSVGRLLNGLIDALQRRSKRIDSRAGIPASRPAASPQPLAPSP